MSFSQLICYLVGHPKLPIKDHFKHYDCCYKIWRLLTRCFVFWGSTSIAKLTLACLEKALTILLLRSSQHSTQSLYGLDFPRILNQNWVLSLSWKGQPDLNHLTHSIKATSLPLFRQSLTDGGPVIIQWPKWCEFTYKIHKKSTMSLEHCSKHSFLVR